MKTDEALIQTALNETNPDFDFSASRDFVRDGGLDSLQTILLVTDLERAFLISVPGDMIVPENFVSVTSLVQLVASCRSKHA